MEDTEATRVVLKEADGVREDTEVRGTKEVVEEVRKDMEGRGTKVVLKEVDGVREDKEGRGTKVDLKEGQGGLSGCHLQDRGGVMVKALLLKEDGTKDQVVGHREVEEEVQVGRRNLAGVTAHLKAVQGGHKHLPLRGGVRVKDKVGEVHRVDMEVRRGDREVVTRAGARGVPVMGGTSLPLGKEGHPDRGVREAEVRGRKERLGLEAHGAMVSKEREHLGDRGVMVSKE